MHKAKYFKMPLVIALICCTDVSNVSKVSAVLCIQCVSS